MVLDLSNARYIPASFDHPVVSHTSVSLKRTLPHVLWNIRERSFRRQMGVPHLNILIYNGTSCPIQHALRFLFSRHCLASVTGLVPTHRITNGLIQIPRMITQLFCGFVMGKLVIALQGIQRISGIQRANMPALCIKLNHRRSSTCHPHRQHRQLSGQTFSFYGLAHHIQQILDFIMAIGQNIALASSSFFCR